MANILVPERYSHDILRGDLEAIGVTMQLIHLAKRKEDLEELKVLIDQLQKQCDKFKEDFENHDQEMQFVDRLVEEHKHEQQVNKKWQEKMNTIFNASKIVGLISGAAALYYMFVG